MLDQLLTGIKNIIKVLEMSDQGCIQVVDGGGKMPTLMTYYESKNAKTF